MIRNSNSVVTSTPVLNHKRSRIKIGPVDHYSSSQHGRLTPNFIKPVFPGDTFTLNDFAGFCYADKSLKLPLQDIMFDQFFFFVPFRIIDRLNWEKVLGYRDKVLDQKTYSIPQISFGLNFDDALYHLTEADIAKFAPHLIFSYLGYNVPDAYDNYSVDGSAYPLMAYWTIWNEFFRDENLDDTIDIDTVLASISSADLTDFISQGDDGYDVLAVLEAAHLIPERVNKLSDILTRGMLSPQKSPDGQPVPIYLAGSAPVYWQATSPGWSGTTNNIVFGDYTSGGGVNGKVDKAFVVDANGSTQEMTNGQIELYADLQHAGAFDINQLRLAWSIQELYETKAKTGSRYISYIRGVWGVVVPDSVLDRPEYLGGSRVTLNNMPVLNTASDLGLFSGYSATIFNGSQFDKTFLEYGFVIGVHCERVFHTYPQGIDEDVWLKQVELDIYNPLFAGIGNMSQKKHLIFGSDHSVFNYQEAWPLERSQLPRASGIFGSLGGTIYQEYREKWLYADYYSEAPTYNSKWLKEPTENVARTMTGELIVNAPDPVIGFQYMFDFKFVYTLTRIIPVDSQPAKLFTRW